MSRVRHSLRLLLIPPVAAALVVAFPSVAGAHVRVSADSTATGSYGALTFRVPTESETAGTVEVAVTLPQDRPFLYVTTKPVPGWKVTVAQAALPTPVEVAGAKITKAVRTVTWKADSGTQIRPGEYEDFAFVAGPLPQPGTVTMPVTQTYSDGKVVRWDQATPASGEEPEFPAPTIEVTAAEDNQSSGTTGPVASTSEDASATPDTIARGLGAGGLVLGLAALVLAARGAGRRSA